MGIISGGSSVRDREYLFVDGGCLRAALKSLSEQLTGNPASLSVIFPMLARDVDKVFYYDAISAQDHGETVGDYQLRVEPEHEGFDRIQALDRFHVSLGETKGKGKKRRQKQVDVRLAVDMLTHTFRGNMQHAVLFAGDDDFIPLVEALVREGMRVTIWHPVQASEALLGAADSRRAFDLRSSISLLTRNGSLPAFQCLNSGVESSNQPNFTIPTAAWTEGAYQFRALWDGNVFHLWRTTNGLWWDFAVWQVGVDGERAALAVIEAVQGWKLGPMALDAFPAND
jgi:hypothetical protein